MPITATNARPSRAPRKTHPMTPRLGVVLLPLFVAGCGLPPAVSIASFAIDALSLAVSDKTVADHALSQIAQKDCAVWRGFTGEELCIDEDSTFAVAGADGQPTAGGADSADLASFTTASGPTEDELMNLSMLDAESDLLEPAAPKSADFIPASAPAEETAGGSDSADLVSFTTASGPTGDELMNLSMLDAESDLLKPAAPKSADFIPASAPAEETAPPSGLVQPAMVVEAAYMPGAPGTVDPVQPAASADRPAPRREWVPGAMVGPGLYYVIGTFSQWSNAKRLAARYGMLAPSVVTAELNSRRVFRVVIGPFGPGEQEDRRALIRRSGIYDAWAVRMKSTKWSVARSTGSARNQVDSIAQLTRSFRF